jgi:formyltetrahydrofolate deformylase
MRMLLTLACRDQPGIVGSVGSFLAERHCNILESAQFGDIGTGRFMMRVLFERLPGAASLEELRAEFSLLAGRFAMTWHVDEADRRPRVLIMVSRQDHCLNDLLYRHKVGALAIDPVAVVSNHRDPEPVARHYGVDFVHMPVTPERKRAAEDSLLALIESTRAELVVLARYMQILTNETCTALEGRAINIHHSFLPSFKGARPYHQAHERGVKLIGATAHYVTPDLDEGPIIDQQVTRVTHAMSPEQLAAAGRDVECLALANAVRYHAERRVFLDGNKTVVFA